MTLMFRPAFYKTSEIFTQSAGDRHPIDSDFVSVR